MLLRRVLDILGAVALVATIAFSLNLPWEYLQCGNFYVHEELPPTLTAMLAAAGGDVIMMLPLYLVVSATVHSFSWPIPRWTIRLWIILEFFTVAEATAVETIGLTLHRWRYTALAPIIPGTRISVIPVLQFMLLAPATFALFAFVNKKFKKHLGTHRGR